MCVVVWWGDVMGGRGQWKKKFVCESWLMSKRYDSYLNFQKYIIFVLRVRVGYVDGRPRAHTHA